MNLSGPSFCQVGIKKKNSFCPWEPHTLWKVAYALTRAFWLIILSSILRKSNQKYFQGAATGLVTLHFTFQSNGAQVPLNHWKHCGWRELAQTSKAVAPFGLLISLLAHHPLARSRSHMGSYNLKSEFAVIWVWGFLLTPVTISILFPKE